MTRKWQDLKEEWKQNTTASDASREWAINCLASHEREIDTLYSLHEVVENGHGESVQDEIRELRKSIKASISLYEASIDDLTLSPTNSCKLQLSVPSSLYSLMKSWASAEGRDLSSVALKCLELGLSEMREKGSIPVPAIKYYELACNKRIALSEINSLLEASDGPKY